MKPLAGLSVVEGPGPALAFLGRMLVDLGASVAKLTSDGARPGTSPAPLDSATAYAQVFGIGKRAIGPEQVSDALAGADVLIWDCPATLPAGWDHEGWQRRFPRLILVTLTPFGADGPFAARASSDLVNFAMSGYLNLTGVPGGTPLKPSVAFASFRHAGNHALAGVLIALRRRRQTGHGSHVDVAIRDTGLWMLTNAYQYWDLARVNPTRRGSAYVIGDMSRALPSLFRCKDGSVVWMPLSGRLATGAIKLVAWMAQERAAPPWLLEVDWQTFELHSREEIDRFLEPFETFFLTKTKAELLDAALKHGLMLAPVNTMADMLEDPQLEARAAWTDVVAPEGPARLPRSPVRISGVDWAPPDASPE